MTARRKTAAAERHPDPAALAAAIILGELPPTAAIGRPDAFPALTTSATTGEVLPLLGQSSKIDAGEGVGVLTKVLYMVPADFSGREACPFRSAGCTAACLAEATGKMSFPNAQAARRRRHGAFFADRRAFLRMLLRELRAHERAARRAGKVPAARLNGTTDLPWHRMPVVDDDGREYASLHTALPGIRFYEYTKAPLAVATRGGVPDNLHLTFSLSERPDSEENAGEWLDAGYSVAAVFSHAPHEQPDWYALAGGIYPVVDGNAHDARFLDPPGSIVALAAKGRARADRTGFTRHDWEACAAA